MGHKRNEDCTLDEKKSLTESRKGGGNKQVCPVRVKTKFLGETSAISAFAWAERRIMVGRRGGLKGGGGGVGVVASAKYFSRA